MDNLEKIIPDENKKQNQSYTQYLFCKLKETFT